MLFEPQTVFGVDFSGAKLAGKNAWIAELEVLSGEPHAGPLDSSGAAVSPKSPPLRLVDLQPLERAARDAERAAVCHHLVETILSSRSALWGMDFPFGLPIELGLGDWPNQLKHVSEHDGDAKTYGRSLVEIAKSIGDTMHIRRVCDRESRTPFDCYHYRIIYQTFHGMRDVLLPISGQAFTKVLPFESKRIGIRNRSARNASDKRVVVEACPSSTLKRWDLPHQNYKQPGGKPPDAVRKRTRRTIMKHLTKFVQLTPHRRRVMMTNSGGDALDAVIAGVGAWQSWNQSDHAAIAAHPRYPIEGRVYF